MRHENECEGQGVTKHTYKIQTLVHVEVKATSFSRAYEALTNEMVRMWNGGDSAMKGYDTHSITKVD